MRTVPHQMDPVIRNELTDQTVIVIDWTSLDQPENGGSQILGYHVVLKQVSSSEWTDLNYPDVPYTLT